MAHDRVTQTGSDETGEWYLWDCRERGQWLVHYNVHKREWTRTALPNPAASEDARAFAATPTEPDRTLAPDVGGDDD